MVNKWLYHAYENIVHAFNATVEDATQQYLEFSTNARNSLVQQDDLRSDKMDQLDVVYYEDYLKQFVKGTNGSEYFKTIQGANGSTRSKST